MDEYRQASERLSPSDTKDWVACKTGDVVHVTRLGISIHGIIIDMEDENNKGRPKCVKIVKIYTEVVADKWFDSLSGQVGIIMQKAREDLLNRTEVEVQARSFRGGDSSDRFEILGHT